MNNVLLFCFTAFVTKKKTLHFSATRGRQIFINILKKYLLQLFLICKKKKKGYTVFTFLHGVSVYIYFLH